MLVKNCKCITTRLNFILCNTYIHTYCICRTGIKIKKCTVVISNLLKRLKTCCKPDIFLVGIFSCKCCKC